MRRTVLIIALSLVIAASAGFTSAAGSHLARQAVRRAPLRVAASRPTAPPRAEQIPAPTLAVEPTAAAEIPAPAPAAEASTPSPAEKTPAHRVRSASDEAGKPKALAVVSRPAPTARQVTASPARKVAAVVSASSVNRWVGFYAPGAPSDMGPITTLQSETGAHCAVVNFFISDSEGFPASRCENVADNGSIPLVTLEFWSIGDGGLSKIANGSKDDYLKNFADDAKAYGKTVWLRPLHEMNGDWYPWGTTGDNTPSDLVAAYRHVHDVFAAEGATNVKFVWCPNVDFDVRSYYPGDAYVDYAAIDGYNNGSPWRSFTGLFGATYTAVTAVTSKPIFLAETSCVEGGSGKAAWIADMFAKIDSKFPRIVGVCWFNEPKTYDWRVDTSSASLSAFKKAAAGL